MNHFLEKIEAVIHRFRLSPLQGLVVVNVLSGMALIILMNVRVLPLRLWDFIFFFVLFLLFAIYRSGFIFALLVGMLPFEVINLAPSDFGINLRPYQLLAVVLALAILIRLLGKRIRWPLFTPHFLDGVIAVFLLFPLLMIPFLPFPELTVPTLKQSIILLSFGLVYVLGRTFMKKESDIRIAVLFFIASQGVVLGYAVWQTLRFKWNLPHFEVMPGRPNGTFPESDFLGGVLAMLLSGATPFGLAFFLRDGVSLLRRGVFAGGMFFAYLVLILTVARSGWLAALCGMIAGTYVLFWREGVFAALLHREGVLLRKALRGKLFLGLPFVLAIFCTLFFHLTNFDLFDRGSSVSSGLQKITVSCGVSVALPERIADVTALGAYGCRHIDLEEIDTERAEGHFVAEIFRDDPNIHGRIAVYEEAFALLRQYPITGIGWGNTSHFFGTDGRGAGVNSSNVFLEVWLGGGVIAFLAFVVFWFSFPVLFLKGAFFEKDRTDSVMEVSLGASWIALTVFNCFNSGLLLGSLWIFFATLVWFVNRRMF